MRKRHASTRLRARSRGSRPWRTKLASCKTLGSLRKQQKQADNRACIVRIARKSQHSRPSSIGAVERHACGTATL